MAAAAWVDNFRKYQLGHLLGCGASQNPKSTSSWNSHPAEIFCPSSTATADSLTPPQDFTSTSLSRLYTFAIKRRGSLRPKPQNLLDQHGRLKVTDFGISALREEQQLSNSFLKTACGTPAFAAPEIVFKEEYDGSKADAFSCGAILFLFLVGKLPFDDSSYTNLNLAKLGREYQFPDWVQKPARSIINRLLDPNPRTRLSIEELTELPWFKRSAMKGEESNSDQQQQFVQGNSGKWQQHCGWWRLRFLMEDKNLMELNGR
ncbi:CBL-interacting serine/threonine-protein kinase 4 [Datura stramonium]|uniref:CBL-interacting serine/threonine-protein kinase 4 n=1 Tax=Datura stramonium TaxID=4076 RepID=A0ABS8WPQ7_DATST|nr:CBL-interacting serine/threonine-protein kinase 4 [Datura stramonium]